MLTTISAEKEKQIAMRCDSLMASECTPQLLNDRHSSIYFIAKIKARCQNPSIVSINISVLFQNTLLLVALHLLVAKSRKFDQCHLKKSADILSMVGWCDIYRITKAIIFFNCANSVRLELCDTTMHSENVHRRSNPLVWFDTLATNIDECRGSVSRSMASCFIRIQTRNSHIRRTFLELII